MFCTGVETEFSILLTENSVILPIRHTLDGDRADVAERVHRLRMELVRMAVSMVNRPILLPLRLQDSVRQAKRHKIFEMSRRGRDMIIRGNVEPLMATYSRAEHVALGGIRIRTNQPVSHSSSKMSPVKISKIFRQPRAVHVLLELDSRQSRAITSRRLERILVILDRSLIRQIPTHGSIR